MLYFVLGVITLIWFVYSIHIEYVNFSVHVCVSSSILFWIFFVISVSKVFILLRVILFSFFYRQNLGEDCNIFTWFSS
jgi:hypothetical protein